jgi:hypothetical protein
VAHRRETLALSGVVESSQLVIPQRKIPIASFHIGAGALEDLRKLGRFCFELIVLQQASLAQHPPRRKERGLEAFG